jgi:hypothetical protein
LAPAEVFPLDCGLRLMGEDHHVSHDPPPSNADTVTD